MAGGVVEGLGACLGGSYSSFEPAIHLVNRMGLKDKTHSRRPASRGNRRSGLQRKFGRWSQQHMRLGPPGMSEVDSILRMRSAGLRPQCPPTISAGASRINKRKFIIQNPSCGSGGDVVTARLAGIAAQAEQGEV